MFRMQRKLSFLPTRPIPFPISRPQALRSERSLCRRWFRNGRALNLSTVQPFRAVRFSFCRVNRSRFIRIRRFMLFGKAHIKCRCLRTPLGTIRLSLFQMSRTAILLPKWRWPISLVWSLYPSDRDTRKGWADGGSVHRVHRSCGGAVDYDQRHLTIPIETFLVSKSLFSAICKWLFPCVLPLCEILKKK